MTAEVHLYGVAAAGTSAPVGARTIEHRDLAALVSDVGELRAAQVMREHWRVLEAAAAEHTVLPVRFGTVMAGEDAVVDDFLAPEHDALAAELRALEGKVQLTVKGTYEPEVLLRSVLRGSPAVTRLKAQVDALPEAVSYGRRIELGQLVAAEVERARERDGDLVMERLEPLATAARREAVRGEDGAVNAAFLVERDGVEAFGRSVEELSGELHGRIGLRLLGPLPPYSFTDRDRATAWA
jgi:hypothetical protein